MKVLLTGAAGRLGSATFQQLADAGYDVIATDVSRRQGLPGRVRVGDLLNREFCYELVDGAEVVVHVANHPHAGASNAQRVFSENVTMNMNVFQAAIESGAKKIIYASSIQAMIGARAYEHQTDASSIAYIPMDGKLPQNPGNHYALSKCVGESQLQYFVKQKNLASAIAVRFPMLLQRAWFADWKARQTTPPSIHPSTPMDEAFTWLSVDDAARLLLATVKAELPGYRCYLPAHSRARLSFTQREIIERFFVNVPLRQPIEQIESIVDISAITKDTGWSPVDSFWGS